MKSGKVVFIAATEYDNLGIGYMSAILSQHGFETRVIDFQGKKWEIVRKIRILDPIIIGFSVIFQYHLDQFINLVDYLREKGIKCHFTAGGHYASLKPEELFNFIPSLDSIVRFEGEYTMLELTESLSRGHSWKKIEGLAYMKNGKMIFNRPRPFEPDLDKFPFPKRLPLRRFAFENKYATILAGRGCIHNCSFCNVSKFYSPPFGYLKRVRKPEMVVSEMAMLHFKRKCSIFLFFDDDFPLNVRSESDWIYRFCAELKRRGLSDRVLWRISCRPDEVTEEVFSMMTKNGLFLAFLGMEDGTNAGLKRLNKKLLVSRSLKGINILKKLEIGFDFGFLLFQPWSTFQMVRENLDFLSDIGGDGSVPLSYLKLMPFYETAVEKELIKEGRLKITSGIRDYDFLSESMNHYYAFIADCFNEWMWDRNGFYNISRWARNYNVIYPRFFDTNEDFFRLNNSFRECISLSNHFLVNTLKELSVLFDSDKNIGNEHRLLDNFREEINAKHKYYKNKVIEYSDQVYEVALNSIFQKVRE